MKKWFGFVAVGCLVLAAEVAYFWALRFYKPDIQKTGQFGDTFQVSVIATRLGVLPALIEQEVEHLASHHADQLVFLRLQQVNKATEATIEAALKQVDHIVSLQARVDRGDILRDDDARQHDGFGNNGRCVQQNLRDLLRYRRDMKTLYDFLGAATQTS